MNLSLLNSLCYTVGWFWCVLFGIQGHPLIALMGAFALIAFQLYYTKMHDLSLYIQDVILVFFSLPLGALLEMLFIQTHVIHYMNHLNFLPPIWIVCLYPLFSLLLNHSLRFVKKNAVSSFVLGLLFAPMSYIAGASLNGLSLPYPLVYTWIVIGTSWGLFLCLLSSIASSIEKATIETLKDYHSEVGLELLYDGECPICQREICFLKKKDKATQVNFVDISSKEFSPLHHKNIDYDTAMSKIHAIDSHGNLLMGIAAFAALYARCNLLVISTLMRIPFIRSILDPFYTLFAKNRLWITGRKNINHKRK